MGDRFATTDMGQKGGAAMSFFGGIWEVPKPKQLQGTSTDMEVRDEYASV